MTKIDPTVANPVRQALGYGQSIWYDGLLPPAQFERMIREDGLRGATTNPAIFEKAIAESEHDDALLAVLKKEGERAAYEMIAVRAVAEVADLFLPVYEQSRGTDGYVSLEVSPHLAYDAEGTLREARELWARLGRKNVMIKIPATQEGLSAIRRAIADGINVNVTLIFSVARHRQVMDAFLSGLEERAAAGAPLATVASVASFFVSRVDTAVDKLLESQLGATSDRVHRVVLEGLLGKAGIANSKAAYEAFRQTFASPRYLALKEKGAQVQRPLWASTGTKNPRYSDVLYVEALMGPDTVDTVPPATLAAFRDHGQAGDRLREGLREAQAVLEKLTGMGIDLEAITQELEKQGVQLFCDAYDKIITGLAAKKK